MKRLLCLAVLSLAVPCLAFAQAGAPKAAPASGQTAEQEISALERAWLEASLKYDVAWFERYMADTIMDTDETGNVTSKAETLANVKNHVSKMESSTYETLKVQVYGDTAIAWGISVEKGMSKGKDVSGRYPWTDTWIRRNGQWQCVATHSSKVPAK